MDLVQMKFAGICGNVSTWCIYAQERNNLQSGQPGNAHFGTSGTSTH